MGLSDPPVFSIFRVPLGFFFRGGAGGVPPGVPLTKRCSKDPVTRATVRSVASSFISDQSLPLGILGWCRWAAQTDFLLLFAFGTVYC